MTKHSLNISSGSFRYLYCFLFVLFFSEVTFAQSTSRVVRKTITLGAQNQKAAHGGFVDLVTGGVYSLADAKANQESIDLIYAYGTTTKINLMMPSSTGLQYFGATYKNQVFAAWDQKNRGTLIALENNRENRRLYRDIKSNEELEKAYENTFEAIEDRPGYKKTSHGPGARIMHLEIGDYILMKSRDRGIFAAGRIVNAEPGFQGHITIDFKITEQ